MKNTFWWGIGGVVVVAALWWIYTHRVTTANVVPTTPVTVADPSTLQGIQASSTPWSTGLSGLAQRLASDSLPKLTAEGTVLHIHQHLDLLINGQPVALPAGIGINEGENWISPIHVHDESGIIHVESPYTATFTLGNFFDIWGVLFTKDCIGGYCADSTHSLRMYVNGKLYSGDPRMLPLDAHQEIVIIYGNPNSTPSDIPASYTFPAGY